MNKQDLAFAPASEIRDLVATGQVSPVELTELFYGRIERLNPQLNAYLTLNIDEAMKSAKLAEEAVSRGDELGALHGVPMSVKDLEMTKGLRTTSGSLVFKDRIPEEDSIVVERLRNAGAIILGKTNTSEFGLSSETRNRLGDDCRNPWNTERTSGGSSGGAGASIAAGLASLASGSDGGGSIRTPASYCGIYGIKPTQGRVPRNSGVPVANQFGQSGPLSRTVLDSAIMMQVISGHDSRDFSSLRNPIPDYVGSLDRDVRGLRIAWSADFGFAAVDPEVVEITLSAAKVFEELGCHIEGTDFALKSTFDSFRSLFSINSYAGQQSIWENQRDLLTDYSYVTLEGAANQSAADYAFVLGQRDVVINKFNDLFEKYDLLLSPTMAVPAFVASDPPSVIGGREVDKSTGYVPFTHTVNMVGNTAASVPCGFSSDGMPIGLHIVGRFGDEETVLAASAAFERARPWIGNRAPVS